MNSYDETAGSEDWRMPFDPTFFFFLNVREHIQLGKMNLIR